MGYQKYFLKVRTILVESQNNFFLKKNKKSGFVGSSIAQIRID